jgi:endo-1,4-beta-xylanase
MEKCRDISFAEAADAGSLPSMLARLLGICVLAGSTAHGVVTRDCALPATTCPIADVARQAGVWVGAIDNRFNGPTERTALAAHFNATTPENEMKWGAIAPAVGAYDFADADTIATFAAANGLRLRGHALVWGRLQLPADLAAEVTAAPDPAARLRELMAQHFATMIGRYGDRVALWDVVNEPLDVFTGAFDPNLFHQTLGPGYVAEAFALARALDPDAELFLNEFALTVPSAKTDGLVQLVRDLRDAGVPIDGVGIQAHFFPGLPLVDPAALEAWLRELGDLGVHVELTEVDVPLWHFRNDPDPLARQAAFLGRVADACMNVPACRAITFWALSDAATWLDTFPPFDAFRPNRPVLLDESLRPKPAYFAVRDAVRRRAVPFVQQVTTLRLDYLAARRAGTLMGGSAGRLGRTELRRGAKALARAKRLVKRAQYVEACAALAVSHTVLATATGDAAPALAGAAGALSSGLRCDET